MAPTCLLERNVRNDEIMTSLGSSHVISVATPALATSMDPLQPFMPQPSTTRNDLQPNSHHVLSRDFFVPSPDLATMDVPQGIKQERADSEMGRSKPASPASSLGGKSPVSPQGKKQLIVIICVLVPGKDYCGLPVREVR